MKKLSFVISILLLSGCSKTFIKKPLTFTTLFVPGETTYYKMHIERTITIHEGDSIRNYIMKYNLKLKETVSEVSSQFITLNLNILSASGGVTHNGEDFATGVFDNLKGHTITVRLTPDGSIADIRGTEKIPTLQGTGAEILSDMEIFSFLYDYLKPGALKPAEIYRKETRTGSKVYRYEGIDKTKSMGDAAYITFTGNFDTEDAGYRGTYPYKRITKGSASGAIYHLLKDGRLVEGWEKFKIKDNYIFPGYRKLNKEVIVYTELRVSRAQKTGGERNE